MRAMRPVRFGIQAATQRPKRSIAQKSRIKTYWVNASTAT
ncbi:hypothetical protein NPIL_517471, partial [Nephila pilipes]